MSNSGSDDKKDANTSTTSSSSIPPIDTEAAKVMVKTSVQTAVQSINSALGSLEQVATTVKTPVVTSLQTVEREGMSVAAKLVDFYENDRFEYGPHIVAGSAFLVGTIVSLRRGKVAGLVSATAAGGGTYAGIYDSPFTR